MQHRQESDKRLPLSIDEFMQKMDKGPLPELFNAIYHTLKDNVKKNEYGYCVTSTKLAATKFGLLLVTGNR